MKFTRIEGIPQDKDALFGGDNLTASAVISYGKNVIGKRLGRPVGSHVTIGELVDEACQELQDTKNQIFIAEEDSKQPPHMMGAIALVRDDPFDMVDVRIEGPFIPGGHKPREIEEDEVGSFLLDNVVEAAQIEGIERLTVETPIDKHDLFARVGFSATKAIAPEGYVRMSWLPPVHKNQLKFDIDKH